MVGWVLERRSLIEKGLEILAVVTAPTALYCSRPMTLPLPLPRSLSAEGIFIVTLPQAPRFLLRGVYTLFPPKPFAPCLCSMDFILWVAENWDL